MTLLGLKQLNSLPHGVAHIRISVSPCGADVDEFFGVFFHGDYVDGKFDSFDLARGAFEELRTEEAQKEFSETMRARK